MDIVEAETRGVVEAVRHPWETARLDVVKRLISRHVRLPAGAVVMDIGCGDAFVVEQLAAQYPGAVFHAVDTAFTPELIGRYRARLKQPNVVLSSCLESITPLIHQEASLILLMDVIEHIEDDSAFLANLAARPYVGRDTRLVITVPAYQSLFCTHDSFLGHHRRYSNHLLQNLAEECGFEVIEIGYIFFSLLPLRVLQVVKERVLKAMPEQIGTGLVTWNGGRAKAAFLRQVLVVDASVSLFLKKIGIRLAGLSNYAICMKSA